MPDKLSVMLWSNILELSSNGGVMMSIMPSLDSNRDGYCVPGVEVKESARDSAGLCSNLI